MCGSRPLLPSWPKALLPQIISSGINMFMTGAVRTKQDLASWLQFPTWRGAYRTQDNMELAAKLPGSASLWLQQGPTIPGSRLRGQSSLLARDVPHIPAQHLKLASGCRGQSQPLVSCCSQQETAPPWCVFHPSSSAQPHPASTKAGSTF